MPEEKKTKKQLKGWQLLYVATVFYLVSWLVGGVIGNLSGMFGLVFIVIAIVTGWRNVAKKVHNSPVFDTVMTVVSVIILLFSIALSGTN